MMVVANFLADRVKKMISFVHPVFPIILSELLHI